MKFADMRIGVRVRTSKASNYFPDIGLDLPEGVTGVITELLPASEYAGYPGVRIALDQPVYHQDRDEYPDAFDSLMIFDVDDDDTDWTNSRDFEAI